MNKKLALILALILTLFLMGSVSAGFFDFLNFGGNSHSNSNVVEDGQYCTADEEAAKQLHYKKRGTEFRLAGRAT